MLDFLSSSDVQCQKNLLCDEVPRCESETCGEFIGFKKDFSRNNLSKLIYTRQKSLIMAPH
jgi:hypothetical protein